MLTRISLLCHNISKTGGLAHRCGSCPGRDKSDPYAPVAPGECFTPGMVKPD